MEVTEREVDLQTAFKSTDIGWSALNIHELYISSLYCFVLPMAPVQLRKTQSDPRF